MTRKAERERAIMARRAERSPEVAAAIAELEAARIGAGAALDELTDATRAALDVPAKVRRNPVKAAALAGGAGFLLLGGPKRVVRLLGRQVSQVLPESRRRRDPYDGLLPDEIEKVLKDSEVRDDPEVRRALEADFAEYLRKKGKLGPPPGPAATFWRTFDKVAGPVGTVGARLLVQRIMEADRERSRRKASVRKGLDATRR